ncbi:MAG: flagellin [Alphaproteobacteria bacterium]
MRIMASDYGNYYSIVQNRQSFTKSLVNVLTEGADNLTLADMNEESANMLALQTRQQLAINSLSLASQAAQGVLQAVLSFSINVQKAVADTAFFYAFSGRIEENKNYLI